MNSYIEEYVINPIQFKLSGVCSEKEYPWYEIFSAIRKARIERGLSSELHQALAPYYKKLLMADPHIFPRQGSGQKEQIKHPLHLARRSLQLRIYSTGADRPGSLCQKLVKERFG